MLLSGSTTHPHHPTIPALPDIAARRIPHDATVAREARLDARSPGREELITRVLDVCTRRSGLPLVLLTGPAGIGRSQVLAQIRARLTGLHVSTVDIRLSRVDRDFPSLVARIAAELGAPPARGESGSAVLQRLLTTLTGDRRLVVFLDDAHRLAPACLPAVNSALGALAGSRVTMLCAVRTPAVDTGMNQLRASGLVHEERLRPLTVSEVEHILTGLRGAEPAPGLTSEVRDACRGIPALVHAAVEGYLASGRLRVVGRRAQLVGNGAPRLPVTHPVFAALRKPDIWPVAKALAVLHPLGEAVPSLIAGTVGTSEDEVRDALRTLRTARVVTRQAQGWRFRVPMLATLLADCLGPYERRRSAQAAVTAIWEGAASCPESDYLPERLVDAGRLVDADRAATELLASSETAPKNDDLSVRWRWAACGLITDPARRAAALHRHAVICARHQRLAPAAEAAEAALRDHQDLLTPDSALELQIIAVAGLASTKLRALSIDAAPDRFDTLESTTGQAVRAARSGQWDHALELARSAIATASVHGDPPGQATMFREIATILIARGQLNRARSVIEEARSRHLLLPHQLALPEAELERTIGAHQEARAVIEDALTFAAELGIIAGTDELWLRLAELEAQRGNQDAAKRCAERIEQIADRLGTADSHRNRLLMRVLVEQDSAAAEALELMAERGRPYEFATTVAAVAECGFADPKLLRAAYEAFGELGALIPRARLRLLMRERHTAVPGRNATVAENERLLATLITEGLTNAQVATVLGTSAKSVEGRLTRFFQRTGYRSRAELATATIRGCVPCSV